MIYALVTLLIAALIIGPQLWVRFVLWRHSKEISDMPGSGAELAEHLIERYELEGVKVVKAGKDENYYSPAEKIVALSPEVYHGKSVTAVAVAAHEVGHAIQFCREEPISRLRDKYLGRAGQIQKIGGFILLAAPILTLLIKSPVIFLWIGVIAVITMLASALMYVAILPEEYDASFNKALPILREGYLPEHLLSKAHSVLKACALTYVAGALLDVLRLWRWIRFIR
ncbi:zinc metallopeptidase [Microbulbifer sp. CAU 1566]|uniref:zinc metallopeptidase n=1 Tax=Microbulbifer sp. CAU 1566 TaxID=2933269 RepID=UPI002002CA0D|nr:zinc metallopeptidase [Microbulbifer sp. CAU 1566]MCK7595820.1 zinc metallopeptidase [Microbulbifer sp. CAU 1566]